jgi:hypothetical protein
MTPHRVLPLLVSLAAACGAQPLPSDALPTDQAPAIFDDGTDWDRLPNFESDPDMTSAVLYGRATARLIFPGGSTCSAALIDDDVLVTNVHCGVTSSATAYFGLYGDPAATGDYSIGTGDGSKRLKQLGVPKATVDAMDWADIQAYDCTWDADEGTRDIAFWTCAPNTTTFTIDSTSHTLDYLPGHVWGHFNVDRGTRGASEPLQVLSTNKLCGDTHRNVLLGEGEILSSSETCAEGYTDCFSTYADHHSGSSGGPVVDAYTQGIFGLVQGQSVPRSYGDECDTLLEGEGYNIGAYLGPLADTYTEEDSDGGGEPVGDWDGTTTLLGTAPRTLLSCPGDRLAAGVVGTTHAGGIGALGLVCVPHATSGPRRLDRSVVITEGSTDLGIKIGKVDFNDFMAEYQSTSMPDLGQPTLAMCIDGYFVTDMTFRTTFRGNPQQLREIRCENPDTGDSYLKSISVLSTGAIGPHIGRGFSSTIGCDPGAYFGGLWLDSSGTTTGVRGRCRLED